MRTRLAVPLAALLGALVLVVGPAAAQPCEPSSAEHAFEELLDIAADDSPLEDEAWRIADEQEAADAFETPETLRMIDELARANDLIYDCATRRYIPASHPDPRDAIENDEEPEYEGPTGVPGDGPPSSGGTGSSGGSSSPGRPGTPAAGGGSGSGSSGSPGAVGDTGVSDAQGSGPAEGPGTGASGDSGSGSVGVTGARSPKSGGQSAAAGGRWESASEVESAADPSDGIGEPGATPDGAGGAVALPGDEDSPDALPWLAAGAAGAVAVVIAAAGMAGRSRGRHPSDLS